MFSESKKPTGDRYLIIYNPQSGPRRFGAPDKKIRRFMERQEWEYVFYYLVPGEPVPVAALVESHEPTRILVAGGDGTLRSVCDRLYWAKIDLPLVFYPLGSANVFALLMGVSQNLKYLRNAKTRDFFPGIFNKKKIFLIAACFGQIATISTRAHKYHKQLLGPFSYLLSAAGRVWFFRRRKVHLGGDTLEAHSVLFCLADFTKLFLPNVESDPKKMTIMTFKNQYSRGILEMIFAKGVQKKTHPQLDIKLAESIAFCGFLQDEVHLDGDAFPGDGNKHRLDMATRPLRFLVKA